jgi:feruloyl esterase
MTRRPVLIALLPVWFWGAFLWAQAGAAKNISEADCTAGKLGQSIPVTAIGEPVSAVTLSSPVWMVASNGNPAYCSVEGSMAPIDTSATARPIRFRVLLPAFWSRRAAQLGGGGMNGVIPNLAANPNPDPTTSASPLQRGFATYGSDSGHQNGGSNDWALNDEAMANLGYMQLKKTHDAAMALIQRTYGERPAFNYFFGTSQGGREALTVAQRYPADYDGIAANVPIVNFSSLMLGPELIRIHERRAANWVTPAKVNAIRGEIVRRCDTLDGLEDGIINNYVACRAIFDVRQGAPNRDPWTAKRCPNDVDPNPADTSVAACLTSGQISTLKMVYSRYVFAAPLANGVKSFGMWLPGTEPSGSGLIVPVRYRGQEGAAPDAPMHSHLGILGVTGFLFKDLNANPLDYVEGGPLSKRREQISQILDSTNPNLDAYNRRGGKLIVVIGTNDTLASPGSQLDYYQAVIDKLGRTKVDAFARFFVIPQATHGLSGPGIPNVYDRLGLLMDWVEHKNAPGKQVTLTGGGRSKPMCSYPAYPKYTGGRPEMASSYTCS